MENIIAFDIGIRNLAWCCYNAESKTIIDWQNYDLLYDEDVSTIKNKNICAVCGKNALYEVKDTLYCTRHTTLPILKDISGNVYKKIPTVPELKKLFPLIKGKRDFYLEELKKKYSSPIEKKKTLKKAFDIEALHDSIRKFVFSKKNIFSTAKIIGLENQPVLKNPTMKTVQILLYATLRDSLEPIPKLKLIHASKKVLGIVGDAGYKERKQGGIDLVNKFLSENSTSQKMKEFKEFFEKSKKQNDLSDALLMAINLA